MKTRDLETERLHLRAIQETDVNEISYNLGRAHWGRGYATEAMKEVISFAAVRLGMKECVTTYAKVNTASANVLHKLGFIDEAVIPYECSGHEIVTEGIRCRYMSS